MQLPYVVEKVTVEDILVDGRALVRDGSRVIFVQDGLPGDVVDVRVFRKKRGVFEGDILQRHQHSADRIEPVCQHAADCGGCKWQHLSYPAQLCFKEKQVRDALTRIGGIFDANHHPILAAPSIFQYRNKLEFSFSSHRWYVDSDPHDGTLDSRVAGFHVPKYFDKVLEIDTCHLQDLRVNLVRNGLQNYGRSHNVSFFDARAQTGYLRNLVFRTSLHTGEMMVVLIVGEDNEDLLQPIIAYLESSFPFITTLATIVNTKKNDSYADLVPRIHYGPSFITERLGRYDFRISPTAFFQTNPAQAERLYHLVYESIGEPCGQLYDLYCGAGSIGIYVSDLAERVVGIEYVEAAVADARANVELNRLGGFEFHAGDIADLLTDSFTHLHGKPDVVVADPPRAGMHEKVVAQLRGLAAQRLIYVSCNPATQARDLQLLSDVYEVTDVTPVDMFPHTSHVESVASLRLR